jgi:hypothetical protein
VPEGLSAAEVGKKISEHRKHHDTSAGRRDRLLTVAEAVLLAIVALIAAYSGFAAAKWGTESSVSLAQASATRTKANRADLEALQIRTLDSVSFNAAFDAYVAKDANAFRIAVKRLRPGYRPAFSAWLATHPATNRNAPPGPTYMPQYRIPQAQLAKALDVKADGFFKEGQRAAATADKYVRVTVFLATVLFLLGISGHFPKRGGRYGLVAVAAVMLVVSLAYLAALPGPPS